jgi:adenylate cyclase
MTPDGFKRKLTAILSADVASYSRLMQDDEAGTVRTLEAYKQIVSDLVKQHRGRVVDSPGDNLLADFASVVDAVQCAVAVQKELQARNAELPENRRMQFRIGVNLGDVIEEEFRIYGDGVNIAARLESIADPGGICISKTAFDQIETKLPYTAWLAVMRKRVQPPRRFCGSTPSFLANATSPQLRSRTRLSGNALSKP